MNDDNDTPPDRMAPGQRLPTSPPTTIVPVGKSEVASMLQEEMKYANDPEIKAHAVRLLSAGHTVKSTSRILGIKPSTIWTWRKEEHVQHAIDEGKTRRSNVLHQDLQDAANEAIRALVEVARDYDAKGSERVKAAEVILDRCGIAPKSERANAAGPAVVAVDIDFDDRLARIVAAGSSRGMLSSKNDAE